MEIREVKDKIEKAFNGNGMLIAGGIFGVLFLIAYLIQSKNEQSETETVKITGAYASYPDTVTNANTITDTMQQSTDYQTDQLKGYMEDLLSEYQGTYPNVDYDKISDMLDEKLEDLKPKIPDSFDKVGIMPIRVKQPTTTSSQNVVATSNGSLTEDYYKKTNYNGVSIVDGLKSIGEYKDSTFTARKRIAKANGIKNYTGTAEQNTTLLNKLKAGTLKRG